MDPLAKGTKSITVCHKSAVYQSDRCETLYGIAGGPWLLLDRGTEGRNVMCGKCEAVERAYVEEVMADYLAYAQLRIQLGKKHVNLPPCVTRKTAKLCNM